MRPLQTIAVCGVLPLALAVFPGHGDVDNLSQQIGKRDVQAGGGCGSKQDNAVCAAGLCCSEEGVCGTGRNFCSSPACQINFGPACDGNGSPSGKDTSGVPRPPFGYVPYGIFISQCTELGKVALTFDDGPNKFTNELLDILKKYNARATFFVTATNGGKGQIQDASSGYRDTIKRMHSEGHQIGSHSWSHEHFTNISAQQRRDQIIKLEVSLVDILGFFPTYLRIPFSDSNSEVLADLMKFGYHIILFNLDTYDWIDSNGDYQLSRSNFSSAVSQHSSKDSSFIAVAHDIYEKTVRGFVQFMIEEALKYKYELVTVGECLGDPQNNWYRDAATGEQFGGPPPKKEKSEGVPQGQTQTVRPTVESRPVSTSTVPTVSMGGGPLATSTSSRPQEGVTMGGAGGSKPASDAPTAAPKSNNAQRSGKLLGVAFLLSYTMLFHIL